MKLFARQIMQLLLKKQFSCDPSSTTTNRHLLGNLPSQYCLAAGELIYMKFMQTSQYAKAAGIY